MEKRGKKGFQLTINAVIMFILGFVVLIAIIFMFTGAGQKFMDNVKVFLGDSNVDLIVDSCNMNVELGQDYEYCCISRDVKLSAGNKVVMTCDGAKNEAWGEEINELNCGEICNEG